MARPRTTDPPKGMIFPQGKGGYTWRPLPDTNPQDYELGAVFGGISSVVTREHEKGDVTMFGDRTTFPKDFRIIQGGAPYSDLFGTSAEERGARRAAQEFYTGRFSKFRGLTDLDAAFGDAAGDLEKRIAEYAAGVAEWNLGEPVMYGESVTGQKAAKIRAEGREPKVTYRFAFPPNHILSGLTRTSVPFHIDAKPALGGDGVRTTAKNYQVALIQSGVIVEGDLVHALRSHPVWAENGRLRAERAKTAAERDKALASALETEEDHLLALL